MKWWIYYVLWPTWVWKRVWGESKSKNIYKMKVTLNESPSEPNKQVKCEYFVLPRFENQRRAILSCFLEYAQSNLGLELHWESHWWNATSFFQFRKQVFHLLLLINKTIQGIAQHLGKCFCLFVSNQFWFVYRFNETGTSAVSCYRWRCWWRYFARTSSTCLCCVCYLKLNDFSQFFNSCNIQ